MVGPAQNVPAIQNSKSANSTEIVYSTQQTAIDSASKGASSWKALKATWKPTGDQQASMSVDVPAFSTFVSYKKATNAELPSAEQNSNVTAFADWFSQHHGTLKSQTKITSLPFRGKLVTSFEPHLRESTVRDLQTLFTQFRHSIGQPKAAVAKAELVDTLTKTYKRSVHDPETRNFASAITLLQDFLRPHWSDIDGKTVEAVSESLGTLVSKSDLGPSALETFYRNLSGIVSGGISVEGIDVPDEDDDGEE